MSKRNRSAGKKVSTPVEVVAPQTEGAVVAPPADEAKPVRTAAATLARYRPGYVEVDGYSGLSVCNGDEVATFLAKHDPSQVMRIAEIVCGLEAGSLATKYAARNNGMKRMNAGNRIRAAVKAQRADFDAVKKAAKLVIKAQAATA